MKTWSLGVSGHSAAASFGVTADATFSKLNDIEQLSGTAIEGGGSGTFAFINGGLSKAYSADYCREDAPVTVSLGGAGPSPFAVEGHVYAVQTAVWSLGEERGWHGDIAGMLIRQFGRGAGIPGSGLVGDVVEYIRNR